MAKAGALNHVCLFLSMMENEKIKGMEHFKFLEMLFFHQAKNI